MMPIRIPFRQIEEFMNRFGTVPWFVASLVALIVLFVVIAIVNHYMSKDVKNDSDE